ncbi:MAG: uracil phosphoribosyltransferase [Gammaproteobacteria bacterium]|nr:uracil phosphoribosyltransferase [Gammaproteobacteria bacterium]
MTIKQYPKFKNFYEVRHPLLQHKLSLLRDVKTTKKEFKEFITEITLLLAYEATKDLPMTTKKIKTPLETFDAPVLEGQKQVILPILRAGIGMVDGFLMLMPSARVAHIGLFRDEKTLEPQNYYFKIPPSSKNRHFFVCDPMLATGGSAIAAVNQLKKVGVKRITFVCVLASPEGIKHFSKEHPDVLVFAASLDRQLNEKGYILPGLGDAGDRIFGTK